jgi:hypothetical protein
VNLTAAAALHAMERNEHFNRSSFDLPFMDPVDVVKDLLYDWWLAVENSNPPTSEDPFLGSYLQQFREYGFPDLGPLLPDHIVPQRIEEVAIGHLRTRCLRRAQKELNRRRDSLIAALGSDDETLSAKGKYCLDFLRQTDKLPLWEMGLLHDTTGL